ncbi:hypothetical protein NGM99_21225 [Mesorhizobium sp. RP14(2022)]|uniref:Uncharacterized protein n=1 Tax=Mesorhizobium liriopis TaxID=2953882 RepID=A0ABT1CBX1_9HYPH|nr:hypothetical protein [Mesorhizobium liriopis]MCO6052315.1 hypothetical protein [Mesorhizobium liriopis]
MFDEERLRDLIRRDRETSGRKRGDAVDARAVANIYESSLFGLTDAQVVVIVRDELTKAGIAC